MEKTMEILNEVREKTTVKTSFSFVIGRLIRRSEGRRENEGQEGFRPHEKGHTAD